MSLTRHFTLTCIGITLIVGAIFLSSFSTDYTGLVIYSAILGAGIIVLCVFVPPSYTPSKKYTTARADMFLKHSLKRYLSSILPVHIDHLAVTSITIKRKKDHVHFIICLGYPRFLTNSGALFLSSIRQFLEDVTKKHVIIDIIEVNIWT